MLLYGLYFLISFKYVPERQDTRLTISYWQFLAISNQCPTYDPNAAYTSCRMLHSGMTASPDRTDEQTPASAQAPTPTSVWMVHTLFDIHYQKVMA